MRAWPARPSGLKLTLASGWYELPWYMPQSEVRRLLELLRGGLEDVQYAVELEWTGLEAVFGRVQLAHSAVALRVPSEVESSAIASAQARLGSVRVGLVLHERVGDWANAAWQQRHVKIPLLAALERELHQGRHPFTGLELAAFPLEQIAGLTDEPVELLELFDAVIDHRLRYAAQGLSPSDWQRSIELAVGDRLADRLLTIPSNDLGAALELAIDARDQPLWPSIDRRDASHALANAGLAWREGSDVLIGALARQAGDPIALRRLLTRLPAQGWSAHSKDALREVLPKQLPLPRAAVVTPEPNYADFPAVDIERTIMDVLSDSAREWDDPVALAECLEAYLRGDAIQFAHWPSEDEQSVAFDTICVALGELRDDTLLELDFERGRLHRFDAVDHALAVFSPSPVLAALVRWIGIVGLSRRVHAHNRLAILANELEHALTLIEGDETLEPALMATLGDLWALRERYDEAMNWWSRVRLEERGQWRLNLRIMLARLRTRSFGDGWWNSYNASEFFDFFLQQLDESAKAAALEIAAMVEQLAIHDSESRVTTRGLRLETLSLTAHPPPDTPTLLTCRAAIALEREDWPHTLELLAKLDHTSDTPTATRARLIWAWTRVALGDLDLAAVTFDELHQLGTRRGDQVLCKLAAQGRAWISNQSA